MTEEKNSIDLVLRRTNVIDQKETTKQITETLDNIASIISNSLGPYGSTTIVEDRFGDHFLTKDGYTILNKINYYYDIPKTVLDLIKNISRSLVKTVGDGSTSSVVVANQLYKQINAFLNFETRVSIAPQDVINILDVLAVILENEILNHSIKITDENLEESIFKVASTSTNNNFEAGKLFCEIFKTIGKHGAINIKTDRYAHEDYFEKINGFEIRTGWINQRMANESDRVTALYDNPVIFMCNSILTDDEMELVADLMETFCLRKNIPLVVIATGYSASFRAFFDANLQKNRNLPLIGIELDFNSEHQMDLFEDLALVLDCKYYDKYTLSETETKKFDYSRLGKCKRIQSTDLRTVFLEVPNQLDHPDVQARISEIEEKLKELFVKKTSDETNQDIQIFRQQSRIANLNNSMVNLFITGKSDLECSTKKFLIEDAISACKSALEYGYIIGGNLIVPKIINYYQSEISGEKGLLVNKLLNHPKLEYLKTYFEDENYLVEIYNKICNLVEKSFKYSFHCVLKNAKLDDEKIKEIENNCFYSNENIIYNLKTRRYEDLKETTIINSAQTDIEIIKSCFSIISLLATSNQFIAVNSIIKE